MEIVTKQILTRFIKLKDDLIVELNNLVSMIDSLGDTDGFFTAVMIRNLKLKKYLEDKKVIVTNVRGGSFPGPKFDNFQKRLTKLTYGS